MLLWREKVPAEWLPQIRANIPAVLIDHAHLERKAATSALNLEKYTELHDRVRELNEHGERIVQRQPKASHSSRDPIFACAS